MGLNGEATALVSGQLGYFFDSSCPNMLWFSLVPRTSNDAFVGFRCDSNSLLKQAIKVDPIVKTIFGLR